MAVDMSIGTEIKNAVSATDQDAQYDDRAKRLLSNKIILAHILVKTVDEFKDMDPKDVVPYFEQSSVLCKPSCFFSERMRFC